MLTRLIGVALLAGLLAGVVTALIQYRLIEPLILSAETLEKAPPNHVGMDMPATPAFAKNSAEAMLSRVGVTAVATVGVAVGYALMLLASMLGSEARIDVRTGLIWGACGFAACGLAPALGLAPELPGSAAADLTARQIWWIATAFATACGLWLVLCGGKQWMAALGVLLLLAPQIIGAPQPAAPSSTVPAETAAAFAARSLGTQAMLWLLIGSTTGWLWSRPQGVRR